MPVVADVDNNLAVPVCAEPASLEDSPLPSGFQTPVDSLDSRKVHWIPPGRGNSYKMAAPLRVGAEWHHGQRVPIDRVESTSRRNRQRLGPDEESDSDRENRQEARRYHRQASNLVASHRRRMSESALSDEESAGDPGPSTRRSWRARRSGDSNVSSNCSSMSSWASGSDSEDDTDQRGKRDSGGILSNLLGLYGVRGGHRHPGDEGKTNKELLRRVKEKRRRWNDQDLFKSSRHTSRENLHGRGPLVPTRNSKADEVQQNLEEVLEDAVDDDGRPTGPLDDILASRVPPTDTPEDSNETIRVTSDKDGEKITMEPASKHRLSDSRRSSASSTGRTTLASFSTKELKEYRERKLKREDPNEPYIPTKRRAEGSLEPAITISLAQRVRSAVVSVSGLLHGREEASASTRQHGHGTNRTLAALIISTSSLAGPATPVLSHYAPASGPNAENNTGQRKIVKYSNPAEEAAKAASELAEDARLEAEEMGIDPLSEKRLNEGIDSIRDRFKSKVLKGKPVRGKRKQKEIHITRHIANILQRQQFIEHLAKSLINFGAPSHNLEAWLEATADVLDIQASFIYFPSVLIIAFRDSETHSTETLFIRPKGILELYRLSLVHDVYRKVVHDEISVSQGSRALRRITKEFKPYPRYVLLIASAMIAATGSAVAFSGSFVDMLMSAVLGTFLGFVMLFVVGKGKTATNIFEIGTAGFLAFVARGLGASGFFCYNSVVSASIVLILPGWPICLGALELGSRNIVSGAIRVVWAIIFTLFLSFTLSIGSEVFDATGISQPSFSTTNADGQGLTTTTITGSFSSNNTSFDNTFQNGTFTFMNGTSSALSGTVSCYRNPTRAEAWWYKSVPDWWLFILVPAFAYALAIWNRADWRSKDMLVMVTVASLGYVVNYFVKEHLPDRSDVVSACAAFTIGLLGNIYSRIGGGSAFPSMVVGILLEVPNVIAAAGGLSISSSDSSTSISNAVLIAIRMVQTAIGLAVGLYAASLVAYPFGKSKGFSFTF